MSILNHIETQANECIKKWLNEPWNINFTKEKRLIGQCHPETNTIDLSMYWMAVLPEEEIDDTIRHEIAHAYCSERRLYDNHGKNWKLAACLIGANPLAVYCGEVKIPKRYIAHCCDRKYESYSKNDRYLRCVQCHKKLIYEDQYAKLGI